MYTYTLHYNGTVYDMYNNIMLHIDSLNMLEWLCLAWPRIHVISFKMKTSFDLKLAYAAVFPAEQQTSPWNTRKREERPQHPFVAGAVNIV